jgi:8-oxo-dGTP diphosphatase
MTDSMTIMQKLYQRMVVLFENKKWYMYRFPMPAITVDLVIMATNGKVLLVTRGLKTEPAAFRGKLAIPGGFVNADETLEDAAIRELKEETGIVLAEHEINFQFMFNADRVDRDPRQRTISAVYLALIDPSITPINVIDTNEISDAQWYDFDAIRSKDMSFDHYGILCRVNTIIEYCH